MSDQLEDGTAEGGAEDESSVIKTLRAQAKESKAAAKVAQENEQKALETARSQLERESQAQQLVDAVGFPGMRDVVLERVEGEVTKEKVTAVLEGLNLTVEETGKKQEPAQDGSSSVGSAASLGSQVASAAAGTQEDDVNVKLANAESVEELEAIAADAGFLDR